MAVATWHSNRMKLKAVLKLLPAYLSGEISDPTGKVKEMYEEMGNLALTIIHNAYVVKSGQDNVSVEDLAGDSWDSLAASTIRRRRAKKTWPPTTILQETGRLIKSLMPKGMGASTEQIFEPLDNGIKVGTGVPYAPKHHHGFKQIPQRRLWPPWSEWPNEWRDRFMAILKRYAMELTEALVDGKNG